MLEQQLKNEDNETIGTLSRAIKGARLQTANKYKAMSTVTAAAESTAALLRSRRGLNPS